MLLNLGEFVWATGFCTFLESNFSFAFSLSPNYPHQKNLRLVSVHPSQLHLVGGVRKWFVLYSADLFKLINDSVSVSHVPIKDDLQQINLIVKRKSAKVHGTSNVIVHASFKADQARVVEPLKEIIFLFSFSHLKEAGLMKKVGCLRFIALVLKYCKLIVCAEFGRFTWSM